MVGDGLAIKPANETVCAPVSGKITVLMDDSKHAVGMTLSNGVETFKFNSGQKTETGKTIIGTY